MKTKLHFKSLWISRKVRLWSMTVKKKVRNFSQNHPKQHFMFKINYESLRQLDQRHTNPSRHKWKCSIWQSGYFWWCRHLIFNSTFQIVFKSNWINMNEKWGLVSSCFLGDTLISFSLLSSDDQKYTRRVGLIL